MRRFMAGAVLAAGLTCGAFSIASEEGKDRLLLDDLLSLLARRASLQRSLMYKFTCTEKVDRQVMRSLESNSRSGFLPEENRHLRHALILEQGADGLPRESRVKLDRDGAIQLGRKGQPVAMPLPPEFEPIARAVPQAQASWFTAESQKSLKFKYLEQGVEGSPDYRIQCASNGDAAVEFVDPAPTGKPPECHALASGQMCLDAKTGDVTRIAYYHFKSSGESCQYDLSGPFSLVEQAVIEPQTGLRFPSRARTLWSISWRDTAMFDQRFEDYRFTEVTTQAIIQPPEPSPPSAEKPQAQQGSDSGTPD